MITARRGGAGEQQRPERAAFLLISGFSMLAYVAAIESLRAANQIAERQLYSWHHVRPSGAEAVASNGVKLACELDVQSNELFELVFVCVSDEASSFRQSETLGWLRNQAAHGAMIGGIGGGAFLLARAGLLTRHRVTLHWAYAPTFAEQFPEARLRRTLYEIDGSLMTCGGGISSLDMLHELLLRRHGPNLAVAVSEWFLHTDIREGQNPQRLSFRARYGISHPGLTRALAAMEDAVEEPITRADLAGIAGVSERQLNRLFVSQLGETLGAYYLRLRLERARHLVRLSNLPLLDICVACGFKSASTFSKSYRAAFGQPPSADRSQQLLRDRPNRGRRVEN